MGIEVPQHLGGGGMTFTSAIIAIEELAKVDPSVSVCVDVQVGSSYSFQLQIYTKIH